MAWRRPARGRRSAIVRWFLREPRACWGGTIRRSLGWRSQLSAGPLAGPGSWPPRHKSLRSKNSSPAATERWRSWFRSTALRAFRRRKRTTATASGFEGGSSALTCTVRATGSRQLATFFAATPVCLSASSCRPRPRGSGPRGSAPRLRELVQIQDIAASLKLHAADFLSGDAARFDARLVEWQRMTRPHHPTEAESDERRREQALAAAGHAYNQENTRSRPGAGPLLHLPLAPPAADARNGAQEFW